MRVIHYILSVSLLAAAEMVLFLPGSGLATTWTDSQLTDPVSGGQCSSHDVVSYGGYIYSWPSKHDMVFWPYTDVNFITHCPDSGYSSFNDDFGQLSDAEKKRLAKWLADNYKKDAKPATQPDSLDWLEKVYSQRDKDDIFWSRFYRLRAYLSAEEGQMEKSMAYVKKAYPLIEKNMARGVKNFDLLETRYLLGEYSRRLGNKKKAREYFAVARETEYTGEDGSLAKGHPYFLQLIEESENVMDSPDTRPTPMKASRPKDEAKSRKSLPCSTRIKQSMANLAIAEEAYFADYDRYIDDMKVLEADKFVDEDVTIIFTRVDKDSFALKGSASGCSEENSGKPVVYVWDSANGGLQERR